MRFCSTAALAACLALLSCVESRAQDAPERELVGRVVALNSRSPSDLGQLGLLLKDKRVVILEADDERAEILRQLFGTVHRIRVRVKDADTATVLGFPNASSQLGTIVSQGGTLSYTRRTLGSFRHNSREEEIRLFGPAPLLDKLEKMSLRYDEAVFSTIPITSKKAAQANENWAVVTAVAERTSLEGKVVLYNEGTRDRRFYLELDTLPLALLSLPSKEAEERLLKHVGARVSVSGWHRTTQDARFFHVGEFGSAGAAPASTAEGLLGGVKAATGN